MPSYPQACRFFALFLCVLLDGCALDKYSFETFHPDPTHPSADSVTPRRSDLLALIYADYVARLLEGHSSAARITREVSDSSLAVAGILTTGHETLKISAETLAEMGAGVLVVREMQKIFNAQGRAEAFADAAYLIRQAQSEYRQYNPNPSSDFLTENGAILVSRVDAALHAARKSLNGRLPALLDLQQATQPMTKAGADRQSSGTPRTIFTAAGDKPGQMEALNARIDAAMAMKSNREQHISAQQAADLRARNKELEDAQQTFDAFNDFAKQIEENNGNDPEKNKASYTALLNDDEVKASGVPAMSPDVNVINQFLRGKGAQKPTEAQKKAIVDAASRLAKK